MAMQLSEVQRAFVQFCTVLQELVLNQQVAHSVVQSLHQDLPALQPDAGAMDAISRARGNATAPKAASALANLQSLAPRLTPTPGPHAAAATSSGSLLAWEVQDNYIILQNAAFKARDLLERLTQLQEAALAAVLTTPVAAAAAAAVPLGECTGGAAPAADDAAGASGRASGTCSMLSERPSSQDPDQDSSRDPDLEEAAAGGGPAFDIDLDVVLMLDGADAAVPEGPGAVVRLTEARSDGEGIEGSGSGISTAPSGSTGSRLPLEPPVVMEAAGGSVALGTAAAAGRGAGVFVTATAPAATHAATQAAAAAAAGRAAGRRPALLSGPELSVVMCALRGEAALEVELLCRVASAVELNTPADDLYVYDSLLKIQPYLDERMVAAALAQKGLLAPPPPPVTTATTPPPRQSPGAAATGGRPGARGGQARGAGR